MSEPEQEPELWRVCARMAYLAHQRWKIHDAQARGAIWRERNTRRALDRYCKEHPEAVAELESLKGDPKRDLEYWRAEMIRVREEYESARLARIHAQTKDAKSTTNSYYESRNPYRGWYGE